MLNAILCRLYYLCMGSTKCHRPPEEILRGFPSDVGKEAKKHLRKAVNKGYIYEKHHGKGRRSYGPTRQGLRKARQICRET